MFLTVHIRFTVLKTACVGVFVSEEQFGQQITTTTGLQVVQKQTFPESSTNTVAVWIQPVRQSPGPIMKPDPPTPTPHTPTHTLPPQFTLSLTFLLLRNIRLLVLVARFHGDRCDGLRLNPGWSLSPFGSGFGPRWRSLLSCGGL